MLKKYGAILGDGIINFRDLDLCIEDPVVVLLLLKEMVVPFRFKCKFSKLQNVVLKCKFDKIPGNFQE